MVCKVLSLFVSFWSPRQCSAKGLGTSESLLPNNISLLRLRAGSLDLFIHYFQRT